MAESKIFVLTHYYPYGNAEISFLKKEVQQLSKRFDKVYLIPIYKRSDVTDELPDNVILETGFLETKYKRPKITFHFIRTWLSVFFLDFRLNFSNKHFYKNLLYYNSLFLHLYSKYLQFEEYLQKHTEEKKIFYTFWFDEWATLTAIYKLKNKQALFYSRAHGYDLYEERHPNKFIPFRPFQLRAVNKLFPISKHGLLYLQKKYPAYSTKYHLRYMGSSDAGINYELKKEGALNIVSCSNFAPVKRVHLIIDALKLVDKPVHWTHFGGGKGFDKIQEKALELPPNITYTFKGDVPNKEVLNFYSTHYVDLFLNVSKSEGLPVSLMEAASFGIPMIATEVGGVSEIVNEQCGKLLKPDFASADLAALINGGFCDKFNSKEARKNIRQLWELNFNADKDAQKFSEEFIGPGKQDYRQCTNCILDTNDDPNIRFDEKGVCNYCKEYEKKSAVIRDPLRESKLQKIISEAKNDGKGKKYDCLLGVSGGVDSTYTALMLKKLGLRVLVVHLDNGWNSALAVENIENIVKKLDFDLQTYVINWEEFKDLQRAYLKANVVDIEALTDHAINSLQYKLARKYNINYIITGANIVTEATLPRHWVHRKEDWLNIKSIHAQFGKVKLKTYPFLSFYDALYFRWISKKTVVPLLDYIDYNKGKAKQVIIEELNWKDYGGKHHESLFTKFYQAYILPKKFHIDKRKTHLSTLICSGQITREEALKEMQMPVYAPQKMAEDKEFVLKKLELTEEWFDNYIKQPEISHYFYPSYESKHWTWENNFYKVMTPIVRVLKKIIGKSKDSK